MTAVDIAVVGGGPAGISAAIAAAETGAKTILIDEGSGTDRSGSADTSQGHPASAAGAVVVERTVVWGLFRGGVLATVGPAGGAEIVAQRIVLATGSVTIADPAPGWTQPDIQLALMAECAVGYADPLGGWVPGRNRNLETSQATILVAGDCAGLCSVPVATAEGRVAGLSAAASLGFGDESTLVAAHGDLERLAPDRLVEVAGLHAWYTQRAFAGTAPAMSYEGIDAPGNPQSVAEHPSGSFICPCEHVPEAAVDAAIADGACGLNDVKRRTRAGMGVCQGVLCGRPIAALICDRTGMLPGEIPPMTARPPVRLIRLADLAR